MTWLNYLSASVAFMCALQSAPAHAQSPAGPAMTADQEWIDVEVGKSFIFQSPKAIHRFVISDDTVATAKLHEEGQVQVRGVATGTTDIWVWYRDDITHPKRYSLIIHQDLSDLTRRIAEVVPSNAPRVYPLADRLVVEGQVTDVETLERVASMAQVFDPEFVNLLSVGGDHQIQIEVLFAEVDRTALRTMGFNFLVGDNTMGAGLNSIATNARSYTNQTGIDGLNQGYNFSAAEGAFDILGAITGLGTAGNIGISAVMSVLEQNDLSKILARPTLTALSGQQAEFLAGGEVPVPVAQNGARTTIEFKEYGVKVVFVPTVLGADVVDMRVYVEVSDIDSSNSLRLSGIEIPAFLSRKSQSHVRVESGKTFAMAGMLHEAMSSVNAKIPILGDLPIIGMPFRYVKHTRTERELMIFVTPRLVRPMSPDEVPTPPGMSEDNNPNDIEFFLLGMDHRSNSRTEEPTGPIGLIR